MFPDFLVIEEDDAPMVDSVKMEQYPVLGIG
jgi:hypothetical protein